MMTADVFLREDNIKQVKIGFVICKAIAMAMLLLTEVTSLNRSEQGRLRP